LKAGGGPDFAHGEPLGRVIDQPARFLTTPTQECEAGKPRAEQRESAWLRHRSRHDIEREGVVERRRPPRPFVGAGRHVEAAENGIVSGRAGRQGATRDVAQWNENAIIKNAIEADVVTAAAVGSGEVPAPEIRWSSNPLITVAIRINNPA